MVTTSETTANGTQIEDKPTKAKRNRTLSPEEKAILHAARQAYWLKRKAAKAAAAGKNEPHAVEMPAGRPVDADGGEQTATVPVTPTEAEPVVQGKVETHGPSVPASAPQPTPATNHADEGQEDTPEIAATKDRISERWAEKQDLKARDEENDFQLGKDLELLHEQRAHHGNGTYDRDVAALKIPKTTAWRLRNHYRDLAGLSPIPEHELVPTGTNLQAEPSASSGPTPSVVSPPSPTVGTPPTGPKKSGANFMRTRAQETKQVTQVRLIPSRHEIFHQALKKLSAQFGTHDDSETIFQAITTYGVKP